MLLGQPQPKETVTMTRTFAALLAAAGATTALATAGATPVLSSARPTPATRTITFQEPMPRVAVEHISPKSSSQLSLGDRLAIGGPLENAHHQHLGTFGGTCTAVGAGASFDTTPLLCQAIYKVAGGQIATMGMMTLAKTNLVIIGGSGAYTGAHGIVTPGRPAQGFSDADKLTIDA
jgi:hypothetical protein